MDIESKEFLDKLVAVKPSKRQIEWQNIGYYNFIHYGMATYIGKEWGDGKTPPSKFNPSSLDTDQWVSALKASGSKGVILTAKHHDGFCLFPSKYTDYTVASSPYKNGKGDIVAELADSCRKYDMKFGIYLSPWDRHEPCYGTDAYNDFYCNQLRELCTNYGELFALWFDGACGEGPNGKKQVYDWERYYDLIRELQPNASICIVGPDVRWIGNEGGKWRDEEWSVVARKHNNYNFVKDNFQQVEGVNFTKQAPDATGRDLGSREVLAQEDGYIWYPAEMDVPITKICWFYNKRAELFYTRKVNDLVGLYNNSVGGNATLLLNVPPNKSGLIPEKYVKRLAEFGRELERRYGSPIIPTVTEVKNTSPYEYMIECDKTGISAISIAEDVNYSQRIERFELFARIDGEYKSIYKGRVVGYKKICVLNQKIETDSVRLVIEKCRHEPHLHGIKLYNY